MILYKISMEIFEKVVDSALSIVVLSWGERSEYPT